MVEPHAVASRAATLPSGDPRCLWPFIGRGRQIISGTIHRAAKKDSSDCALNRCQTDEQVGADRRLGMFPTDAASKERTRDESTGARRAANGCIIPPELR